MDVSRHVSRYIHIETCISGRREYNNKKCIGLLVNHSTMCVMHCYKIVSNIQWSVCTSIRYNLLCRNSPNLNLTSVCLLNVVDVYTTATSDVLLLQMEHCRRNVWALHRPVCRPSGCRSPPLRKPEVGCLSCSTWWDVTVPRHHISSTCHQLYIARKLMLLLSLSLSPPKILIF
jgi:hypothetical protein